MSEDYHANPVMIHFEYKPSEKAIFTISGSPEFISFIEQNAIERNLDPATTLSINLAIDFIGGLLERCQDKKSLVFLKKALIECVNKNTEICLHMMRAGSEQKH